MKNTPQTDKATARPWQQYHAGIYQAASREKGESKHVCDVVSDAKIMPDCKDLANAELIVRAVNEYAALVAVAEAHAALLSHVTNFQQWIREGKSSGELFVNLDTSRDKQALANLAAVRGGK